MSYSIQHIISQWYDWTICETLKEAEAAILKDHSQEEVEKVYIVWYENRPSLLWHKGELYHIISGDELP